MLLTFAFQEPWEQSRPELARCTIEFSDLQGAQSALLYRQCS